MLQKLFFLYKLGSHFVNTENYITHLTTAIQHTWCSQQSSDSSDNVACKKSKHKRCF